MQRTMNAPTLLTLNAGSSSLKFAVFTVGEKLERVLAGTIGGIGKPDGTLKISRDHGEPKEKPAATKDHAAALEFVWHALEEHGFVDQLQAVGHRVVHGGPKLFEPHVVDDDLLAELRRLRDFAPEHLPAEIALIEAVRARRPELAQIACFDTAFHRDLPRIAQLLPLPRDLAARGIRRYGFHGLSYAFLMEELARLDDAIARHGRIVLAHLGNGASLAAVRDGRCIDTSMAFTPAAGIPMSTRSGDIDPGVLTFLARAEKMPPDQLHRLVNFESGLRGISETTGDLRELLELREKDARAADAIASFCYHVKKWIGAFAAALGGLDTLVFAGGVGEHAAPIRAEICDGLSFLGVRLDSAANTAHRAVISHLNSAVIVRVIRTDEEQMIARAVCRVLAASPTPSSP